MIILTKRAIFQSVEISRIQSINCEGLGGGVNGWKDCSTVVKLGKMVEKHVQKGSGMIILTKRASFQSVKISRIQSINCEGLGGGVTSPVFAIDGKMY